MTCKDCKLYQPLFEGSETRTCHAYPPVFVEENSMGQFPAVTEEDWCAEWKNGQPFTSKEKE